MPSEQRRRKDDTWTSEELHKALKGSKDNMIRKKRDEGVQRRHHGDVNGSDRKRDQDGRSHHKDEDDKKSRRHKDRGDSPDNVALTEEDREKLRQDRRARREGGKEERKSKPKETKSVKIINDEDIDRHSEKKHHRREESQKRTDEREGERRKLKEDVDQERRHHRDSNDHTTKRRHKEDSSLSQRHHDDTDQQRHHKEDRKQITEEDYRHHPRKKNDDHEEERERRRQERREKREQEKSKDKDKNGEKGHRRHEKSERDRTSSRHNKENDIDKSLHRSKDRYDERYDKERGEYEAEREYEKSSSRQREREQDPEKRSSRHKDIDRESEKSSRRHHEDNAKVSFSSTDHLKSENKKSESKRSESGDDDYNYEEDFEDYDDDFEEDEIAPTKEVRTSNSSIRESEMDGVLRALDEENNKVVKAFQRSNRSYSPQPSHDHFREDNSVSAATQPTSFINFVSAKQRVMGQALTGKSRKRFDDLSRLIELDVVAYDMFDLQPVKEYDMYIRSFGRSDTKQAYVQTRDDDIDRDIQTEEIETLSKWTQHPPNDETAVGGEGINVQGSEHKLEVASKIDVIRLNQFLDRVGQMMLTILDEESQSSLEEVRSKAAVSFCNNVSQLGIPNILTGRRVITLTFCQGEPNYLLSVHSTSVSDSENIKSPVQNLFVISVWNLSQAAYPYRMCVSQVRITCACFSPVKASLVFAGMHDGSVALWDLREPSSLHRNMKVDGKDHLVRFPTYNTAGVMEAENHHSSVISIAPVYSSIVGSQKDEEVTESSSGLSFQVVSVEEKAVVNLWVAAEVVVSDPAGSETDLGLSPGGKIKLLRSSCIVLSNPDKYLSTTNELRALNLHLDPSDLNHFYVGTDTGHVVHGVRFGKRIYPHNHCSLADSPVPVVSLDFSPFGQPYFLAGCDDGTLHLFHTKLENPIATWQGFISGEKILHVRWSHSRPTVFFVLDNSSTVFTFDLVENGLQPVTTDTITAASATFMEVGGDPNLLTPGNSRPAYLALALSNNTIEVLTMSDDMRQQQPLEEAFMASYVDRY